MRSVFVNLGPLVSFRQGNTNPHESAVEPAGMGFVVDSNTILKICDSQELIEEYSIPDDMVSSDPDVTYFDVNHRAVVPGLVDTHTHLLWAGDRSREVSWRREGKSYAEIASLGGGIQYTVQRTKLASDEELHALGYQRLREALRTGTTHLEAKSGYGLDTETEIKMLRAIHNVSRDMPIKIVSTFLGAHAVRFLIEISLNYYSPSTFTHKIFHTTGTPRSRT